MQQFDWERYWVPLGKPVVMDGAFVVAPVADNPLYPVNNELVSTDSLPQEGIVVLLGEAGLGKTTELERLNKIEIQAEFIDLGEYGDENRLASRLATVLEGANSDSLIVLDGLDEALVGIPKAGEVMVEAYRQASPKPNLRISCRTAAWPPYLSKRFEDIAEDYAEYELCMLTEEDVTLALETTSSPDETWKKIHAAGSEPLVAKPSTLAMLVALAESSEIPSTRLELYHQGLLELCKESQVRLDRSDSTTNQLTPKECLAIAQAIAGRLILSGNSMITRLSQHEDAVTYEDLSGGSVATNESRSISVSIESIRHVVEHTALFSGRTSGVYGFAHRSYGEFLAARYLMTSVSAEQRDSLVHVDFHGSWRISPQLNEVTSWLADMDEQFRTSVLKSEPVVILRSDLASKPDCEKVQVAESLLAAVETETIYSVEDALQPEGWGERHSKTRQLLERLSCPSMSQAIRPWLIDSSKSNRVKDLAIDLAWFCRCKDLGEELLGIVLDSSLPTHLRVTAGYSISEIGPSELKSGLKQLLNSDQDDPDDQLKGVVLRNLWPGLISSMEMLNSLSYPQDQSFYGSYKGFLSSIKDASFLGDDDLIQAIAWAKKVTDSFHSHRDLGRIAGLIVFEGWKRLEDPSILNPLAELVVERLSRRTPLMRIPDANGSLSWKSECNQAVLSEISSDDDRRRALIAACMERLTDSTKTHIFLNIGMGGALAVEADFEWAIGQCLAADDDEIALRYAELARSLCMYANVGPFRNPAHVPVWLKAHQQSNAIRTAMNWPLQVDLGSELAKQLREQWEEEKSWEIQRTQQEPASPKPAEVLVDAMNRVDSDGIDWAPSLIHALMLHENSEGELFEDFTRDPTQGSVWLTASDDLRSRILHSIVRYLDEMPLPSQVGTEGSGILLSAWASIGLRIVVQADGDLIQGISTGRIQDLVPHLIDGFSRLSLTSTVDTTGLQYLYSRDGVSTCKSIVQLIVQRPTSQHLPSLIDSLAGELRSDFAKSVFAECKSYLANHPIAIPLVVWLIAEDMQGAFEFAVSQARSKYTAAQPDWGEIGSWLRTVASANPEVAWPKLHRFAAQSCDCAKQVLLAIPSRAWGPSNKKPFHESLSDAQLTDLLLLLFEHFDPTDDPLSDEGGVVTDLKETRRWRNSVLNTLVARGTKQSVAGLCKLSGQYPQHEWLKSHALQAVGQAVKAAWAPPSPLHLIQLESQAELRTVNSKRDLVEIISSSLTRWERHCRKMDQMRLLWNEVSQSPRLWRPKDEEDLSQTLVSWLNIDLVGRGIVLGRELQFSRRTSQDGKPGTRTDIVAIAESDSNSNDQITVIVEVKGSWHAEAATAMRTQLVDRYLVEHRATAGLYVVGWYDAPGWDPDDRRMRSRSWEDRSAASSDLHELSRTVEAEKPGIEVQALVLDCSLE
jgi:hypothetical protein